LGLKTLLIIIPNRTLELKRDGETAMALAKQAKILSKAQQEAVLAYLAKTRNPLRNRVIFLLSVKAGLRAKEIASLTWAMVTDAEGALTDAISLTDAASKGRRGGRAIPLNKELRIALEALKAEATTAIRPSPFVITTERACQTSSYAVVNMFSAWYQELGFQGASSHSGRRTAITAWARRISSVGGSLRDVQLLAGHSALSTTQRYIEGSEEAKRRVVEMI
jgi:integrase/recombinase XerD